MQKSASSSLELHIQKYWEDSVTMLASAQESEKSKETTMLSERTKISYKIQKSPFQDSEMNFWISKIFGKLAFSRENTHGINESLLNRCFVSCANGSMATV